MCIELLSIHSFRILDTVLAFRPPPLHLLPSHLSSVSPLLGMHNVKVPNALAQCMEWEDKAVGLVHLSRPESLLSSCAVVSFSQHEHSSSTPHLTHTLIIYINISAIFTFQEREESILRGSRAKTPW
jgi:hypothetical protein